MAQQPDNVEVFWHDGERTSADDCWTDTNGEPLSAGWYFWSCFPGCMPEGDPNGPYETEDEAWAEVEELWGDEEEEGKGGDK